MATLDDIARQLQISKSTVSKALSGAVHISGAKNAAVAPVKPLPITEIFLRFSTIMNRSSLIKFMYF